MLPRSLKTRSSLQTAMLVLAFTAFGGANSWDIRPAQAAEAETPKITTESVLTAEQAKRALADLSKTIEAAERDIQKLRHQLGASSPTVIQAEQELKMNRDMLPLYRKLIPLLVGKRDTEKKAEIESLSRKLEATAAQGEREQAMVKQHLAQSAGDIPNLVQMQMQEKLEAMAQALQAREQALVEAKMQLAKFERDRLPQIESGDLKIYTLQALPAQDAALSIESLFGAKSIRVAVDNRTNSLIVYGDREALPTIDALLQRLDQQESTEQRREIAEASQPLVLRVFWLADGVGHRDAIDVLPESVIKAAMKLGIETPWLVTQTTTTLNVSEKDGVEFETSVPALLFDRSLELTITGKLSMVRPEHAAVVMHAQVNSREVHSDLRGSIAMPLGHYMILGTSNTVISKAAAAGGGGQAEDAEAGDASSATTTFNTTPFAFVVQVIPAESFAPGG